MLSNLCFILLPSSIKCSGWLLTLCKIKLLTIFTSNSFHIIFSKFRSAICEYIPAALSTISIKSIFTSQNICYLESFLSPNSYSFLQARRTFYNCLNCSDTLGDIIFIQSLRSTVIKSLTQSLYLPRSSLVRHRVCDIHVRSFFCHLEQQIHYLEQHQ